MPRRNGVGPDHRGDDGEAQKVALGKTREPSSRTAAQAQDARRDWAQRIRLSWAKAVEAIVDTGKQLIAAKADIPYGEFHHMIHNDLPFSGSTAERLMAIARHKVLSDPAHARSLPAHWTTLAELSRLPPRKVLAFIKDDTISPSIERRDAEMLVAGELARKARVTEQPGTSQTLSLSISRGEGFTPALRSTWPTDLHPDVSEPSGEPAPALRQIAAEATEIIEPPEPPIDRLAILNAAWEAATPDDRQRFLDEMDADRIRNAGAAHDVMARALGFLDLLEKAATKHPDWIDADHLGQRLERKAWAFIQLAQQRRPS